MKGWWGALEWVALLLLGVVVKHVVLLTLCLELFVWLKMRVLVFTLLITILTGVAAVAAYFAVHFVRNRMQHLIAAIVIWMLEDAIKQQSCTQP